MWRKYLCHPYPRLDRPDSESVTTVNGSCLTILGKSPIKFVIDSHEFPFEARVIENLSYDVILGRDFLKEFCFQVNFENGSVNLPSEPDPLTFKGVHLNNDSDLTDKAFISLVHASQLMTKLSCDLFVKSRDVFALSESDSESIVLSSLCLTVAW